MQLPETRNPGPPRGNLLFLWGLAGGMLLAWLFFRTSGASDSAGTSQENPTQNVLGTTNLLGYGEPSSEFQLGQQRAQQFCAGCHDFPDSKILDKATWALDVLPEMAKWLGMSDIPYENLTIEPRVAEANLVPKVPMMSSEEWRAICTYYLADAPVVAPEPFPRPPIQVGLKQFEVVRPSFQTTQAVTMVKIDPPNSRVFASVSGVNGLYMLGRDGQQIASATLPSPAVALRSDPDGMYALLIGHYLPSDTPLGELIRLTPPKQAGGGLVKLIGELQRPVDMAFGDVNGDGREDVVVAGYGNYLGELSWFEVSNQGEYLERVIFERPGCVRVELFDFNRDGALDIVALFAQAREGLFLFLNDRKGNFTPKPIVEKHSAWGFSFFELVDFNKDGHQDILVTNGDNGDTSAHLPAKKNFHGIRLYQNDGQGNFKETWFFPMNGAYKALARDFDADGDLDIAAISYYPDYRLSPRESFLLLENKGAMQFDVFSFAESFSGRWLCMDAGDIDGDGDADIVLGSFIAAPTHVPYLLRERWIKEGPAFLYLRNTLK